MLTTLLLSAAAATAQTAPVPLSPAKGWVVDFAENSCLVWRDYGGAGGPVTLGFRMMPNAGFVEAMLIEPRGGGEGGVLTASLMPNGVDITAPYQSGPAGDGRRLIRFDLTPRQVEQMSTARSITLSRGGRKWVIAPQAMAKAMAAGATCQQDLLRRWAIDPAQEAKIVSRPEIREPEKWVAQRDYPQDAMRDGAEGDVVFRVHLDRAGRVSHCATLASSGHEALDRRACEVVRERGSFPAARLADGTGVPTVVVARFAWRLPS